MLTGVQIDVKDIAVDFITELIAKRFREEGDITFIRMSRLFSSLPRTNTAGDCLSPATQLRIGEMLLQGRTPITIAQVLMMEAI